MDLDLLRRHRFPHGRLRQLDSSGGNMHPDAEQVPQIEIVEIVEIVEIATRLAVLRCWVAHNLCISIYYVAARTYLSIFYLHP